MNSQKEDGCKECELLQRVISYRGIKGVNKGAYPCALLRSDQISDSDNEAGRQVNGLCIRIYPYPSPGKSIRSIYTAHHSLEKYEDTHRTAHSNPKRRKGGAVLVSCRVGWSMHHIAVRPSV